MQDLALIVLTFNEELHLARCLESVASLTEEIYVVDSFSSDATVEIARASGATVLQHEWTTARGKLAWAMEHCPIQSEWVMRLDADEYLLPELADEIATMLPSLEKRFTAVEMKRRVLFMDRWIRWGGYYPTWLLRIWRHGKASVENRRMDEHIVVAEGGVARAKNDFVDHNLHDLTWWTEKHNRYAVRESIDILVGLCTATRAEEPAPGGQAGRRRWLKTNVYLKLPLGLRPWLYYLYRMIIRGGILDGRKGLIFHTLQGLWYRLLVDGKVLEIQRRAARENVPLSDLLSAEYDADI